MEFINSDITVEDLREIIRGLRMQNFAYVEQDALTEVNAMIRSLPSTEQLKGMEGTPNAIKKVQIDIGKIMKFIELYGKRDPEYKVRYKSRTGLPPRYNVLEWRAAMKETRNDIVKELVSLSQEADDIGLTKIAVDLLGTAKDFKEDKMPVKELWAITQAFCKEAVGDGKLIKEAQAFTDIRVDLTDIRSGLQQITAWFNSIQNSFTQKVDYLQKHPKTQKFVQTLANIWKQVSQLQQNTNAQIQQIDATAVNMEKQMDEELVPQQMPQVVGRPTQKIEYVDDPNNSGYQIATVVKKDKDGNDVRYEVQEDENGKKSLGPVVPTKDQSKQSDQPETAASGQVPQSVIAETNTLETVEQIDAILQQLPKVANVNNIFYKEAKEDVGLVIPKNIMWFINQNKANPAKIDALRKVLEQKKQQISGMGGGVQKFNPEQKVFYNPKSGVTEDRGWGVFKGYDKRGLAIIENRHGNTMYVSPKTLSLQEKTARFNLKKYLLSSKIA